MNAEERGKKRKEKVKVRENEGVRSKGVEGEGLCGNANDESFGR